MPIVRSIALTLVLVALVPAVTALPGAVVATGPGAWLTGFATPVTVTSEGAPVDYANADVARHNVVALAAGPDSNAWCAGYAVGACPLFWSPLVGAGATVGVSGADALAPAEYGFYCELHPNMRATLVVTAGGDAS